MAHNQPKSPLPPTSPVPTPFSGQHLALPAHAGASSQVTAPVPQRSRGRGRPTVWHWLQMATFAPTWLPRRWRHPAVGYVCAVLMQVVAILLTLLLAMVFPRFAFSSALIFLGVTLVALNWGALPSVAAAVVGGVLYDYVVLQQQLDQVLVSIQDGIALVLLVGVAVAISLLTGSAERSKRAAKVERAAAQERALVSQQEQARMEEFLAIASHDLRSPVTAVGGYNDLAARNLEQLASAVVNTSPDLVRQVEVVRARLRQTSQSVDRLYRLVDLLFDAAQVRMGNLDLCRERCDLAAVVRVHMEALRVAYPQRTLRLGELPAEPALVVADADRIGQVLTNYVTNAMKYSDADQPVDVRMKRDGKQAMVFVADYGPGLPPQELERIWQRFYQAGGVHVRSGSSAGLGLGLHICKAIVEAHGGAVGVHSEVGKGSTFWFALPLANESARAGTPERHLGEGHKTDTPAPEVSTAAESTSF